MLIKSIQSLATKVLKELNWGQAKTNGHMFIYFWMYYLFPVAYIPHRAPNIFLEISHCAQWGLQTNYTVLHLQAKLKPNKLLSISLWIVIGTWITQKNKHKRKDNIASHVDVDIFRILSGGL